MPRKPKANPSHRPLIPIDWDIADKLLEAGCNGAEVAAYFNIHADTFYRRIQQEKKMGFTAYQSQKLARGDSMLRSKQFQEAMKGDKTMLIWLGKQRLNQTEKVDSKNDNTCTIVVVDYGSKNKTEQNL